ncbi:MAG: protein kinase, partial [Oscillibacter sp.]|nr:protein kinase [Oscillibacter sp.]
MPQVIANTYEVIREIGSGGGGIVYLGRHQRLNKLIVIKEDKRLQDEKLRRRLTEEMLRREVDALKNLSHTYIPQVYDYVQEDGKVYTVMDYIEGESLDKLLERGEEIPQSKVVEWACELLDALCYLHSRPPHGILHSDIKPPNIMITPQGDIRLIDFNIALALGEEGAVRVGFSRGYASPEHYGTDFTVGGTRTTTVGATGGGTRRESTRNRRGADTGSSAGAGTGVASPSTGVPILNSSAAARTGSQSTSGGRTVLLDVRSDIYSLGATLYHVLTGERPAANVLEVKPITAFPDRHISPAVAAIITKAMNPNPDRRYQTAKEMLAAFEQLHNRDPRTRRRRRHMAMAAVLTLLLALAGSAVSYVGLRQSQREEQALVLCAQSREALDAGNVDAALDLALSAIPENPGLLDPPTPPEVQRAVANALGVYDLADGYKAHRLLALPASPIKITLSQAGTRAAALSGGSILVFDTESGEQLASLTAVPSALSDFLFRDANTLLYAGPEGLTAWDLVENRELWHTGIPATAVSLSGNSMAAASAYRDADTAYLWDARTGDALGTIDFGGRKM